MEALRALLALDFMRAQRTHLPHRPTGKVSNRVISEVRGINRVVSLNGASAVHSAEAHDEPVRRHRQVAVAGYGRKQDPSRAHCAGFNYYFIKPIDFNRLAQLLEQSSNTAQ